MPLTDNDPVDSWIDVFGNEFTATGTSRPIFKEAVVNGLPVVRFDGVNDFLQDNVGPSYLDFQGNTGLTIYAVMKVTSGGLDKGIITKDGENPERGWALFESSGKLGSIISTGASSRVRRNATTVTTGNFIIAKSVFDGGTTQSLYVDGVLDDSSIDGAIPSSIGGSGPNTALIGDFSFATSNYFNGDIAEIIVFDRVLSGSEQTNVETYLTTKYGL
jgi:hypothetical protein